MIQEYDPSEKRFAYEIADALNDRDSLVLHLQYVRKYKEGYLRKTLEKVMSIDESKIKRNRAALYTFLINNGNSNGNTRD